ncbi:hypothetical protein KS4_18870 [Poriferisphaera corsica]|uniref:Uncharacterized protein n=1 Tax=Poriferisphaera corsica TaxID=2528020 RepID=A0A517YUD1_9BACT|nr:hypothetical protein [Poriferisphaera corsica]QDU33829.1 hypothetical protein KS4_18870 [Poriferisphaera corsica]
MLRKLKQASWRKSITKELDETERKDFASFSKMCTCQPQMILPVLVCLLTMGIAILVFVMMESFIRESLIHVIGLLGVGIGMFVVITKIGNAQMLEYRLQFFERRRIVTTKCVKCGYDLQMIERDECPECGRGVVREVDEQIQVKIDANILAEQVWLRRVDQTLVLFFMTSPISGGLIGAAIGFGIPMLREGSFWFAIFFIVCCMVGSLVCGVILYVLMIYYRHEIDGIWDRCKTEETATR